MLILLFYINNVDILWVHIILMTHSVFAFLHTFMLHCFKHGYINKTYFVLILLFSVLFEHEYSFFPKLHKSFCFLEFILTSYSEMSPETLLAFYLITNSAIIILIIFHII